MRYKMKNETLTAEIESFGAGIKIHKEQCDRRGVYVVRKTGILLKERHRSCFRLLEA